FSASGALRAWAAGRAGWPGGGGVVGLVLVSVSLEEVGDRCAKRSEGETGGQPLSPPVCSLSNTPAVKDQQTAKWTAITRRLTGTHRHTGAVLPGGRPYLKDLPVLADSGYEGAGAGVHVPVKKPAGGRELDPDTRTRTRCCVPCATRANAASR